MYSFCDQNQKKLFKQSADIALARLLPSRCANLTPSMWRRQIGNQRKNRPRASPSAPCTSTTKGTGTRRQRRWALAKGNRNEVAKESSGMLSGSAGPGG